MRRTDLMDTSPEAHRRFVELLRGLTPERRFRMVIDRVDAGREMQRLVKERLRKTRETTAE